MIRSNSGMLLLRRNIYFGRRSSGKMISVTDVTDMGASFLSFPKALKGISNNTCSSAGKAVSDRKRRRGL